MKPPLRAKPLIERADKVLANPELRLAKRGLTGWRSEFVHCDTDVFQPSREGTVVQPTRTGHVEISQELRTFANRRYRLDIEAVPAAKRGNQTCAADLQPKFVAFKGNDEVRSHEPAVMRVSRATPSLYRAYFQCPENAGRLQLSVRFCVRQPILIKRIRLVESGDYLPTAHPLAVPPEPWREMPPCLPDSVLLCDGGKDNRRLLTWLREVFESSNVQRVPLAALSKNDSLSGSNSDTPAVVIDSGEDRGPSLQELVCWADRTIVIASLETFAATVRAAGISGMQLQDRICGTDMPTAKVTLAGYHTRGFALADDIPYCWSDDQNDFAHRYLLMSKPAKAALAKMGIHASLVTETGEAATRKHPLVLYRQGARGVLIVMDPAGLEATSAGQDVHRVFDQLWRSALGRDTVTLGQYVAPPPHYQGVMTDLTEVAKHFDMLEDLSPGVRLRREGNPPPTWVWPSRRADRFNSRKTLFIRTGFFAEDWPAVYGMSLWLKRVAMKSRLHEPVTRILQDNARVLAWPVAAPQNWRGCPESITEPQAGLQRPDLAGLVDLAVGEESHTTILVPDKDRAGILQRCLGAAWSCETEVVVAPQAFDEPLAGRLRRHSLVCKVLLPGIPRPEHGTSVGLTDLVACLLERLAFGTFGWIVPNRDWRPLEVDLGSLRAADRVVCVDAAGSVQVVRRGRGRVMLSPGDTLVGMSNEKIL